MPLTPEKVLELIEQAYPNPINPEDLAKWVEIVIANIKVQVLIYLAFQWQWVVGRGGAADLGVIAESRAYQGHGIQLVYSHPSWGHGDQSGQADADHLVK